MKRTISILFNLAVAFSMLFAMFAVQPASGASGPATLQAPPPPRPEAPLQAKVKPQVVQEVDKDSALARIDPRLRELVASGVEQEVDVFVSMTGGLDLEKFFSTYIVRPSVFPDMVTVFGKTTTTKLMTIAMQPGVISVADGGLKELEKPFAKEVNNAPDQAALAARLEQLKANELTFAEAQAKSTDASAQGWFDVLDGHKSSNAWEKGFTGEGVIVAVIDDGVDFGHPDLMGTYAWVTDEDSPYYGWPMAFSQASTQYFAYDAFTGSNYIASGAVASRWSDTQYTVEYSSGFGDGTGTAWFQPLGSGTEYEYTFNTTSASGFYKLGSFPEENLTSLYGHRVAVLVVDENASGVYDTVYVDLDNDKDFSDEKPATKDSPEIYRDMDGDGYSDISGGLLAWISDGDNPPPVTDWLWGVSCGVNSPTMKGCPDSGELVTFAGAFAAGYTHGTQCASNVAGQGVVSGGLSAAAFRQGGMVQGAAPDVGIMDMGTFYQTFADEDHYLVAALGYDGESESGDEVQVATNSYGAFTQMWGSWGYTGRLITAINLVLSPSTMYVFSGGNEGPGYGPQEGEAGPTIIKAGTSTQFGSTNWDSITDIEQIMYGDPSSFGAKGPNRDGSAGLDVLGNGGRGAGDEGINYYGFNGAESWATWGGTSRSAPVVGGNLALLYEAFHERYGRWPTWDEVMPIVKSSATNSVSSPFLQGAGVVNSDRSTDVAAGIYGVYATPDEWQVGDWMGEEYLSFAKVAVPGETYSKTYTVFNPSGYEMQVDLSEGYMSLISSQELTFTTSSGAEESTFNFHSPDYLMELDSASIPADAELMVVRYVHPYSTFDPAYDFTANPSSSWRFLLYNWTDANGDGMLWEDLNGNGAVNHVGNGEFDNDGFERLDFANTEIQEGEYIRTDYEFGGLSIPIFVNNPLERMADGYFFGFQHRYNDFTVDQTTFKIGVEFYKRADWGWLNLSDDSLIIPPESEATFVAEVSLPADVAPGAYEGVIYMFNPGDAYHPDHESALPVVVNVIADLEDAGSITFGGGEMADTLYQNSWTNGYFNWYGGGWTGAGDWRHYFFNVDEGDLENGSLLLHTSWNDPYPTDINTWLLGPTADCASNDAGCDWPNTSLGAPWPDIFGPYTLQPVASSEPFRSGAAYPFNTSTGGPDDWVIGGAEVPGLHEVALHNVLYSGEELAAQFQTEVGQIHTTAEIDPELGSVEISSIDADIYTDTGSLDVLFTPTIEVPGLVASLSGGLETSFFGWYDVFVPDTGGCYSAWCPGNVYEYFNVDQAGATELVTLVEVPGGQDIDYFLVYDANDNGTAEEGIDPVVGSSGNSAGTDEVITIGNPALGGYFAVMDGFSVEPDSGIDTQWYYQVTHPGPLPTDPADEINAPITVTQDVPFEPTSASYSMTVTANDHAAALYVELSNIPAGNDVDVYVSDETGIIAQSQTDGDGDEYIEIWPDGNYRFEAGKQYTIWVHGFSVPGGPITPTLHVWWDVLNLWLSATHPDVHAMAIGAGETVSVTVHWDKPGMGLGELLSARLVVAIDPAGQPAVYDDLVNLTRNVPRPPDQPMPDAAFNKSFEAPRGESSYSHNGYPTFLANTGDVITFTLDVMNTGEISGTFYVEDYIPRQWEILDGFVYTDTVVNVCEDCFGDGSWDILYYSVELEPGESSQNIYRTEFYNAAGSYGWVVPNYMDVYDEETSYYYGGTINYAYVRSFRFSDAAGETMKFSDPYYVAPGGMITYTLSLYNPSSEDREVWIKDTLPEEVEFVDASEGWTYDPGTHTVVWSGWMYGSAYPQEQYIWTTVGSDVEEGTWFENEAFIAYKYEGMPAWWMWAENFVDDGFNPELVVEKTVDDLLGPIGTELAYNITLTNEGDETAFNTELVDVIPAMLDIDEASITGGATYADGVLYWSGDLGAGETVEISFNATINATATPNYAIINTASVTADNWWMQAYNSALTEVQGLSYVFMPLISR